ncbi:Condensin complex subunit 1 [Hirschfeldia incana]|nr:Condensin complex subunit 1 [Hirschfeldia incana]
MAPPFVFPQILRALEEDPEDNHRLFAQNHVDVTSLRPSDLEEFVKGVSFDLSDRELFCIEDQDVFDRVYSLVRSFYTLPPSSKCNLVESLRSNLSVLLPNVDSISRSAREDQEDDEVPIIDRITSHRNALKIYTFFLITIVMTEESHVSSVDSTKVVGRGRKKQMVQSWNWEPQRGRMLNLIANSLDINLSLLFGSSELDENYLSFIVKNSFSLFENAAILKDPEAKDALCRIIGACATKYRYTVQSCASVMHLIHKYDFSVVHVADAVARAESKYSDGTLAVTIIRDIGRTDPKAYVKDTVGADNVGRFLVELADRLPKVMSTNVGVLVPHFGGESYKIRNALVGVLGKLVAKAFNDVEGDMSSKSLRLRTKQAMLEILLERCRDVSAYTRSRVLQVWAELCEEHSVSIGLWNEVASISAGRLEDKSAIVRKSALNLLITMLQHNPFGPQLRIASFEATLEQYKRKLNELEPNRPTEESSKEPTSDGDSCNGDGEIDDLQPEVTSNTHLDSLPDSCQPENGEEIGEKDVSVPDIGNLEQTKALIASLEAGLSFSKCMSASMPILVQLMASSSASDVENAILLLMRCKQFQIDGAEACLRKILPLAFSQDKSIYEAVENAFISIYVRKNPVETAKQLLNLAIDSNIGDQAALEFIVNALVSKGEISSSTTSALWDFFCFNINGTTAEQSRGALSVLCMAAKSSSRILGSHIQDIIDIGFGRWAKVEPLLARTACTAIQRLSEEDKKKLLLSSGSRLFSILESLITGNWLPENIYYATADKAISAIYMIHPTPEALASTIIKKSLNTVFDVVGQDQAQNDTDDSTVDCLTTVHVAKLSRFLFVVSHIAMNQLVYIESCIQKIRRQKTKKDKAAGESQNTEENPGATQENHSINAELGLAASDDALLDTLAERAEREIVSGGSGEKNLIGDCATFLSKLCRNFSVLQKHPELQASAMLALCRCMIIDANFCESNLQLLFTVVENAPSEVVRSNCTLSLGDFAVRFPNLLEPWTENMYARLRDASVSVRKNAVLVLSHLILNDMMKVKGHINEMAICIEDDVERISSLAKLFFHELSKKGSNPIYNLLPDILGQLSNRNLKRESFCNVMQFLIGSIKKDKQMEALVEKLCNRFSGVTDTKQWEYISYSLSLLTFTEKGIKKLIESFKSYEHALAEDLVTENFRSIINKGKKFAKPELKACIEEFEEKVNKFHMEKKEQEETARNAQVHIEKTKNMESLVVPSKVKEEPVEEYDDDDDEDVSESEIVDPSMEEQEASLNASDSEEDASNTEEEPSDSEEVPDSEQNTSGGEEEEGESESSNVKRGNRTMSSSSIRGNIRSSSRNTRTTSVTAIVSSTVYTISDGLVCKNSPTSVPISKLRNLFKLSCVMQTSIDGNTHSVVNTTPDSLNAIDIKEEASVATLLMNMDNEFDPFDAMSTPLYQTATFKQPSAIENGPYDYTRSGNPTRDALESLLAKLDKADRAFCFTSGMAALASVTHLLNNGDEIVAGDDLYGGSDRLLSQVVPRSGVVVKRVNTTNLDEVAAAIGPHTKLVWVESPTNPRQQISDIRKIAEMAHAQGALMLVDNSMMSPVLSRPLELGADIVMHSATKFIAGHSDVMAGVLAVKGEKLAKDLYFLQNSEGSGLAPFDCWL